jgi:hypothetical protein
MTRHRALEEKVAKYKRPNRTKNAKCDTYDVTRAVKRYLEDDSTVFAATEVYSRLILNERLARNQRANKIELIFAISDT